MAWLMLVCSGVMESVWAIALDKSEGFTQPGPTIIFIVAMIASFAGLAFAVRTLPIGVAYAVWTGIGAALTVIYSMVFSDENFTVIKALLLAGLVGCIVGLKLVSEAAPVEG